MRRFLPTALLGLAVAACGVAPLPPPLVTDATDLQRPRLERVGGALAIAGVELCRTPIGIVTRGTGAKAQAQCRITIREVARAGIGAAADGDELLISAGMLAFVRDDDELAVVLAHRLAHRIAEPPPHRGFTEQLGDAVGLTPAALPEPVFDAARERTADRVSLFLLARADVDPAAAPRFWRRLAALPGDASDWTIRHPVSPERIAYMDEVTTEIALLRGARQPLIP